MNDQSWFPQPPPKPLKAPPAGTLVLGTLVTAAAVVAAILWLAGIGHSSPKAQPAPAPAVTVSSPATASSAAQRSRSAFAECMQSMGADSGSRGRGRFSRGPSKTFRTAIDVCRSLAQPDQPAPTAPARTATTPPPVA